MSDIFTTVFKEDTPGRMKLAYGLIILIDLAEAFYKQGDYLNIIAVKYGLPLAELEPIVVRLEGNGLLERHPDDQNRLMLKRVPEGRWIFDIIPVLECALKSE